MFGEAQSFGNVFSDDTSSEAVVGVVGTVHHLIKAFELEDALDWAKNL